MRRHVVLGTAVVAAWAAGACDDVFGLTRSVDAAIDTPIDAALGAPDAPADAALDAPADAPIDGPVGAVCPATYGTADVTLPSTYRFVTTPLGWDAAQAACAADQIPGSTRYTHLVVIDDDPERSRLTAVHPMRTWLGLTDRVSEGVYRWITNAGPALPASGSPWTGSEPDHAAATDDCVEMNGVADYAESDCGALLPFWCECDTRPIVPATF
ncbi:MAG: C-type lectin domain-containing protein [Myxococcales bacterium]|nr:C-type lectin domain-containing protein [Myxococcales bacterium]